MKWDWLRDTPNATPTRQLWLGIGYGAAGIVIFALCLMFIASQVDISSYGLGAQNNPDLQNPALRTEVTKYGVSVPSVELTAVSESNARQDRLRIPQDIPDSPLPAVAASVLVANSNQYGYGQIIHVYGDMVELYQHGGECFALLRAGVSLEYKSCDSSQYWEVGDTVVAVCTMGSFNPRAQGNIAPKRGYQLTHNCDTPAYVREAMRR